MNTVKNTQNKASVKKTYTKPQIVYKQALEAVAAACSPGKASTGAPNFCNVAQLFS